MGLLDWLSEAVSGTTNDIVSGGNPMQPGPPPMINNPYSGQMEPRRHVPPMPTGPMPPVQGPGMDVMPTPQFPKDNPEAGLGATPQNVPMPPPDLESMMGKGPPPGVVYPQGGDPMTAGGMPPGRAPPLPPPTDISSGGRAPPMPPPGPGLPMVLDSYRKAGGTMMDTGRPDIPIAGGGGGPGQGILARALGLNANQADSLRGSLAAGLKAAGENANKGKGAAFMGSAGAALEGGQGRDDKTFDKQGKVVDRATRVKMEERLAKSGTITDQLNQARTNLANEQTKMAKAGGKDSVLNSQSQLYLRAMGLVNGDPEVKLAKSTYDAAIKVGDANSPEVKAAKKAHEDLVKAKTAAHLQALGLDPKLADKIGKQPGMSQDNPMPSTGMTQQKLDALPPGTWVMGPNGKPLQKKGPPAPAAGANQPAPAPSLAPAASTAPVQPPLPPASPRLAMASMGADDEEE